MPFTVILFVLTSSSGILCDVITTTEAPKTVSDFVDVLKRDLRRNNDDYIESTTLSVNVPNPYLLRTTQNAPNSTKSNQTATKQGTFYYQRGTSSNKIFIDTAHRRVFHSLESFSADVEAEELATNKSKTITIPFNMTPIDASKVTAPLPQWLTPITTTAQMLTYVLKFNRSALTADPSFRSVKKKGSNDTEKLSKIKNFIARNKQLLEEFMNKKKIEATKAAKTPNRIQPPAKTSDSESELSDEEERIVDYGNPRVRKGRVRGGKGLRLRTRARPVDMLVPTVRVEELDMAHAKGGHIHALRLKNRLCHRHVLIPEGPKYDSRGKQYVPAYGHHRGRNFSRTREPAYLLPRCCNCCKKSLLGCE